MVETISNRIADARETYCPGPFWELLKVYNSAKQDEVISLYSTESYDSETRETAPEWIMKSGNSLLGVFDRDGYYEIVMKKTHQPRHS